MIYLRRFQLVKNATIVYRSYRNIVRLSFFISLLSFYISFPIFCFNISKSILLLSEQDLEEKPNYYFKASANLLLLLFFLSRQFPELLFPVFHSLINLHIKSFFFLFFFLHQLFFLLRYPPQMISRAALIIPIFLFKRDEKE